MKNIWTKSKKKTGQKTYESNKKLGKKFNKVELKKRAETRKKNQIRTSKQLTKSKKLGKKRDKKNGLE